MRRVLLFAFIFIFAFAIPSFADDDLFITNWDVDSNLLENGDLSVNEDITFRFNDDFNGIFREIVLNNTDGIEGLEIYEVSGENLIPYGLDENADVGDSNVYATIEENNALRIQVFSPSEDEDKTFRFNYKVNNVAILHEDTGEFYYQYLGEENETFIEYFSATLSLPQFNSEDIQIFAHGPLNGTINFNNDNLILLQVEDVGANNFIEARVLYPTAYTPLSTRTGNSDRETILNQERKYQQSVEDDLIRRENIKSNLNNISLIVSGLGAVLIGFLYRLTKRNPEIFREMDDIYPEDISPAELNIFRNSTLSPRAITATIFDLARREHIAIEELNGQGKKLDLNFTRTNKTTTDLLGHEIFFMDWLFNDIGAGDTSSTRQINIHREKSSIPFNKKFHEWTKRVREDLSKRNYYEKKYRKLGVFLLIITLAFFIFGIVSIVNEALYGIALLVISMGLMIFSIGLIGRLSDKGYIQKRLWDDFNKEIKAKKKTTSSDMSDKHLVYAVAMDHSVEDINSYRSDYPMNYFPLYWGYFFMLNSSGGSVVDDSVNNSFYGYTGSSGPSGASFGGGGGFTGGGGGGAGGGGAGGF